MPLHELFEENVQQYPHNTAYIWEQQTLTYQQLNQRANRLAHYLKKLSLPLETPIAVALPPGIDLIVALLAILKVGCAYVPLNPQDAMAHIHFVLQDCQAQALITQANFSQKMDLARIRVIAVDAEASKIAAEPDTNLDISVTNTHLAYICYTSGSTGEPKGVMIEHKGIVRLVKASNYVQITPQDRIAQVTRITFDVAAFEIWGALLNGAALIGLHADILLNAAAFAEFLNRYAISILWLTSRLFDYMALITPQMFRQLTYLLVGGEVVNPHTIALVMQCPQGCPRYLLNGYGPTENSVFTTTYAIPADFDPQLAIPIGRPITHTTAYVLDDLQQPVADGQCGELCVGGEGVARGYLNRPQLNREQFILNPFSNKPNERLYRTGDIVYWRNDGNLEYVGRRDSQVKIHGFRIELGAVENGLLKYPLIGQCVVLALSHSEYDKILCAFIVARDSQVIIEVNLVKSFFLNQFPAYMLPEIFIVLEKLPLNSSGKADRAALIQLAQQHQSLPNLNLLQTDAEKKLAQIWTNLLGMQTIGPGDDFFALGGHSLLILRLQNKIRHVFHQELSLSELLSAPRLTQQAQCIDGKIHSRHVASTVILQPRGMQTPLFLLPPVSGECYCFFSLLPFLPPSQPVYALRDPSEQSGHLLFQDLVEMAAFYVDSIKQIQPHGPYQLAGYSFGAQLAIAMTEILMGAGEAVDFLGILDGWAKFPPHYIEEFAFRQRMHLLQQKLQAETIMVDLAWQRMQLLLRYHLRPLPVKITLFKAADDHNFAPLQDDYNHWLPWAAHGIDRCLIPGDHDTFLVEPQIQQLAHMLMKKLSLREMA